MIAHLGMYDMAHTRAAHDRFWALIRSHLGFGPAQLKPDGDFWEVWQSPDLLLSQTCGLPFRAKLVGDVQLVGTPDYGLPGCPPGYYYSEIVVRHDDPATKLADLRGRAMAYNERMSQSGWAAPLQALQAQDVDFAVGPETGSHAASAQAVADGDACFAALDAVTWQLLQVAMPDVTGRLRVLARTAPTPGLPYITALKRDANQLRNAIRLAIADLNSADRACLRLRGIVQIPAQDYTALPLPRL